MSLFGDSPPPDEPSRSPSRSRTLFDDDNDAQRSSSLFDDDDGASSPWDTPTPRRRSRADTLRNLLRPSDVPASYIEAFNKVLEDDDGGSLGKIGPAGVRRVFVAGRVSAERRDEILGILGVGDGEVGRNEFNVLLALVGLVQEGERVSLDAVDERRGGEFGSALIVSCPLALELGAICVSTSGGRGARPELAIWLPPLLRPPVPSPGEHALIGRRTPFEQPDCELRPKQQFAGPRVLPKLPYACPEPPLIPPTP